MTSTTWIAKIEADHTIKAPADLPVGEEVMIVRLPSLTALLNDPERSERFAATRAALHDAVQAGFPHRLPTNEEIIDLVKRARSATRDG